MKKKLVKLLFALSCVLPAHTVYAQEEEKAAINTLVYMNEPVCESILVCNDLFSNHNWSAASKRLCNSIRCLANVAPYDHVVCVIDECLSLDSNNACLLEYQKSLQDGSVVVTASDLEENATHNSTRGCSKFTRLSVGSLIAGQLLVNGNSMLNGSLTVNGPIFGPGGVQFVPGGSTGATGAFGTTGTTGAAGATGATGATGASSVGAAVFVDTTNDNTTVASGSPFTISTLGLNNIPGSVTASPAAGSTRPTGTAFTLATGTYVLDYEMSLDVPGSIGVYTATTLAGPYTLVPNTQAGSSMATTWIHGRAFVQITDPTQIFAISSVGSTPSVVTAGTATGVFMIRLTILKIA